MNRSISVAIAGVVLSLLLEPVPAGAQSSGVSQLTGAQIRIITRTSTASTDTITQADCGRLISYSNSGSIAVTLPVATALLSGCWMDVENGGSGSLTITPTTSLIDGASSISLPANQGIYIVDAGSQYLTERGQGSGSSSSASSTYSADGATLSLTGSTFSVNTAAIASRVTATQGLDSTCVFTSGSSSAYAGAVRGNALTAYADGMTLRVEIDTTANGGPVTVNCGPGAVPVYQNDGVSNPTSAQWHSGAGNIQTVVFDGALNTGGTPAGAFVLQSGGSGGGLTNGSLKFAIDGGGSVPSSGSSSVRCTSLPFSGTITGWTILANPAGSMVVDIWQAGLASSLPTVANSIVASAPPALSSASSATSTALTGWTTTVTKGNVMCFSLTSAATLTWAELTLSITRSN